MQHGTAKGLHLFAFTYSTMAEKTEKATPKKLRDARKKGQVAKSQDFPSAITFIVSLGGIIILGAEFYQKLAGYMQWAFQSVGVSLDIPSQAGTYIQSAIELIFTTSLPFMILVSLAGVLVGFLVVGPCFSFEAMKPDLKRLNPVTNIRNIFRIRTLFELLKSIFKIAGALLLIYSVVYSSLPDIISTASLPVLGSAIVFSNFLTQVVIRVGIFFLIIAIFDLMFQKRTFAKQMMMEKHEVRQEIKDTEGDPNIRWRRRQVAQEIAYQEGPASIKRARTVITNPVHIAVALEYKQEEMPAPKILTMGRGLYADQIVKFAQAFGVPIMRNVTLAQQLYNEGTIGHYIPEDTYKVIAEILKWLGALETKEAKTEEFNPELFE